MKKLTTWLVSALTVLLLTTPALAASGEVNAVLNYSNIEIAVDGVKITPVDVTGNSTEPFTINGTVYLPIRAIAEALDCNVEWDSTANTVRISSQTEKADTKEALYVFHDDAVALITDAALDKYFKEGSALEGVEALLNAGSVYVNGQAVPATEDETDSFVINGFPSLWKTGENTWAYSVHKLYSGTDLTFEEARLGFIQGISQMRGLTMELYDYDNSGYADRIETTIKESTLVYTMTVSGTNTTITRYDYALATDEDRPDVNDLVFPTKNVDPDIQEGDVVHYWFDGSEWHMERAKALQGTLIKGDGDYKWVLDGVGYIDTRTTRYNLYAANRTAQFLTAHTNLGLEEIEVTMWLTDTGYAVGLSRGDNAPAALALAIQNVEKAKADVSVSVNGSDVSAQGSWVTADTMTAFNDAIAAAQAVLDDTSSTNTDMDAAIYKLSSAFSSFNNTLAAGLKG